MRFIISIKFTVKFISILVEIKIIYMCVARAAEREHYWRLESNNY